MKGRLRNMFGYWWNAAEVFGVWFSPFKLQRWKGISGEASLKKWIPAEMSAEECQRVRRRASGRTPR